MTARSSVQVFPCLRSRAFADGLVNVSLAYPNEFACQPGHGRIGVVKLYRQTDTPVVLTEMSAPGNHLELILESVCADSPP